MKKIPALICGLSLVVMLCTSCGSSSKYISDVEKNDANQMAELPHDKEKLIDGADGNVMNAKSTEQYDAFMKKVEAIERYSKENFENATTQTALNTESYAVYVKWDALLNEVFQYLKSTMNAEQFSLLEAEEVKWIQEKERGMDEAAAEWKGGSGEPLARNSAGIRYTSERCYFLISLVK